MDIRCKKCFKGYDESFGLCPRCGHDNNIRQGFENVKDKQQTKVIRKRKPPFLARITNRSAFGNCSFCGSDIYNDFEACPICKSKFNKSEEKKYERNTTATAENFVNIAYNHLEKSQSRVNLTAFRSALEKAGFDLDAWNDRSEYQTGELVDPRIITAIIAFGIFLFFGSGTMGFNFFSVLFYLGSVGLTALVVWPICKSYRSRFIEISRGNVGYYKPSRYDNIHHELKVEAVDNIELIFDSNNHLDNVIFTAKRHVKVDSLVFSAPVEKFDRIEDLPQYLMLYCLKHDIKLLKSSVSAVDNESEKIDKPEKESLYIRTDYKVTGKTLTEEDFQKHLDYLNRVATERYFMGGGFEQASGGMIIFAASDMDEAHAISSNDPIIANGSYTYDLKEWNVLIKSS